MDNLVLGKGIVLALACIMWGVFYIYYKVITRYVHDEVRRIIYGFICLGTSIGLLFSQMDLYSSITGIRKPVDNDMFFFLLGIVEWLIPACALFVILAKRRSRAIREKVPMEPWSKRSK